MTYFPRRFSYVLFVFAFLGSGPAHAVLNIEITQGVEGAVPIAVAPFSWRVPAQDPKHPSLLAVPKAPPVDVAAVVSADLARSGRFDPLARSDMLASPDADSQINFTNWRIFKMNDLVVGTVKYVGADIYKIRFRLFDVFKGTQIAGYSLSATASRLRQAAHQVSDIIYQKLTGEPGAFDTNVAYITVTGRGNAKRYTLWVADADGYNAQTMVRSRDELLSPAWSPDGKKLAYASAEYDRDERRKKWSVYVQDVATGRREKAMRYKGRMSSPAFSPDGRSLAVSMNKDGNSDIYVIDLLRKKARRLTTNWAIDTEPEWMPDGKSILFTSDRGGKPQIYQIPAQGGQAKRLTFEGNYNARATVSYDGKRIGFIHRVNGNFRVAVMDLDTGNLRVLTDGTLDESPSFAPNGSMIIYATSSGMKGVLAAVSVDGRVHQRLTVQNGDVREPAWSPIINK
jgi:TolB protein